MRFRRRYLVLASLPSRLSPSAARRPRTMATCPPADVEVAPSALPGSGGIGGSGGSGATAPVALTVQTATNYGHPGDRGQSGKVATVTMNFDNDVVVNLGGIRSAPRYQWRPPSAPERRSPRRGTAAAPVPGTRPTTPTLSRRAPTGWVRTTPAPIPATADGRRPHQPPTSVAATWSSRGNNTQLLLFARTTTVRTGGQLRQPGDQHLGQHDHHLIGNLANPPGGQRLRYRLPVPASTRCRCLWTTSPRRSRGAACSGPVRGQQQAPQPEGHVRVHRAIGAQAPHNAATDTVNEPGGSACT